MSSGAWVRVWGKGRANSKLASMSNCVLVLMLVFAASVATGCGPAPEMVAGNDVFSRYCALCHQTNGEGVSGAFPPLTQSEWAQGDKGRLIRLVLNGMQGPITVNGQQYNNVMTPHAFLTDEQIANVLTYVRLSFGNEADAVSPDEVARVRAANTHEGLWLVSELEGTVGIP